MVPRQVNWEQIFINSPSRNLCCRIRLAVSDGSLSSTNIAESNKPALTPKTTTPIWIENIHTTLPEYFGSSSKQMQPVSATTIWQSEISWNTEISSSMSKSTALQYHCCGQ
jgi:hypothetical protein